MVYEAHALPSRRARRWAENRLFGHPRFAMLVAISQALADDYAAAMPKLAGRPVLVAHDAADPVPNPRSPPSPWPGRPGAPQLGYVGHLYPGKGMEMVAALAAIMPEADLHAVGGTERDLAAWRARCADLPNVHLHGYVPHALVSAYLARFDLLLAPPAPSVASAAGREIGRWMSPLKLFEYMAAGKPILASDIPALREILRDGETAVLLPPGEAVAWAAAARTLLRDPLRATDLGERACADFLAHHTWDARAAHILARLQCTGA
jgi:glycosyltransferase involved in cell wall biosynthesis